MPEVSDLRVVLYYQIVDYKVLTFHSVLAHIEFEQGIHAVLFAQCHTIQTHIRTDECAEFLRRYFSQTFESGYFGFIAKTFYGSDAFIVIIAINGIVFSLFLGTAL